MTITSPLTVEESAALAAACATLRPRARAAFERDVAALLARGMSVAEAIRALTGIVPARLDALVVGASFYG